MTPEEFLDKLHKLPRPLLVAIVLLVGIVLIVMMNPPHTICDTQKESLKESQTGILFPIKSGGKTYPGKIIQAKENCYSGNSSGACFEYFSILRRAAQSVKNGSPECVADMLSITVEKFEKTETYETLHDGTKMRDEVTNVSYRNSTLQKVLTEALDGMVRKAWGESPPEPGVNRYGWFQEFEVGVFCHIQDVVKNAMGPEAWAQWQRGVLKKLPGEAPPKPGSTPTAGLVATHRLAVEMFPEQQVRERSLFSVPCSRFR